MPKKSQAAKHSAGRRPTPAAARHAQPTLVRPSAGETTASNGQTDQQKQGATATMIAAPPKRVAPAIPTRSAPAKTRTPTTPKPATSNVSANTANKSAVRAANQLARRNTIRAENFAYAIHDLRVIAVIAAILVAIMLILHAVLPPGAIHF